MSGHDDLGGLRVAYVCTDPGVPFDGTKGASGHVREVVHSLVRLGAKVKVFTGARIGVSPRMEPNVELVHLPNWPRKETSGDQPMVETGNEYLKSALVADRFDLVYERYALWGYAGMEYAKSRQIPGILEVNAPLIEEEERYRSLRNRPYAEEIAHRTFNSAKAIIAVSRGVARYLERFPEAKGKTSVIQNGVDPDKFGDSVPPSRPAPKGTFTVGFVGSLKAWHGLDMLAESFRILASHIPDVRLLVVGDGPGMDRLKASIAESGFAEKSEFAGAVPSSEVPGLIASMDACVAPYQDIEGFYFSPLKINEYMASGKPVVSSRVGDLSDLISDGEDGFLVAAGDAKAFADVLQKLALDSALRVRIGTAARSKMSSGHTWEMTVRRILEVAGVLRATE